MGMKAMNCPGHMLVFGERGAQLPRPAAALPRADAAAPQRGVGRALRPHARAAVLAGRCALLRHARTRSARKSSGCSASCSASTATSAWSSRRSCRRGPTEFLGEVGHLGPCRGAAEDRRSSQRGPGLHDQRGRRRVLRAEDRLRRHRRDRAEVAVRDDSARLPDAAALRPEVHRRGQRRAPPGRHPPRDLRQLRAVHRAAHRALRGRVPAVAGAGAGDRAADRRPAPGVRGDGPRPPGRRRPPGGARRAAGEDWI